MNQVRPGTVAQAAPAEALITAILDLRFEKRLLFEALDAFQKLGGAAPPRNPYLTEVDAYRAQLSGLAEPELRRVHSEHLAWREAQRKAEADRKDAEQEAKRFYNQAGAQPDFGFWVKLEYWTFEESIGLLLKRNPRVVTWTAVQRETEPSRFLRQYHTLWAIAERAHAMTHSPRLRPADVVAWAIQSGAVEPPAELVALTGPASNGNGLPATVSRTEGTAPNHPTVPLTVTGPADDVACHALGGTERRRGTPKAWTDSMKAELRTYKERHGTKAAADKYGISPTRVRQLLASEVRPQPLQAHNPFARQR